MLISVWRWFFLLFSSCLYFPACFVQRFSTTCFMLCEISWKSEDVFALLDAISSGMTLSHERWSSDMQRRQQITWCWLQKKSIMKSGCFEHFVWVVSTSSDKVDITSMSMTWWVIDTLLPLCDFTHVMQRASSQSTHHLKAGTFSSILVHEWHLLFNDIHKV